MRRALAFLGLAAALAAVLGLRGRGGRPPSGSGWRELEITEPGRTGSDRA